MPAISPISTAIIVHNRLGRQADSHWPLASTDGCVRERGLNALDHGMCIGGEPIGKAVHPLASKAKSDYVYGLEQEYPFHGRLRGDDTGSPVAGQDTLVGG